MLLWKTGRLTEAEPELRRSVEDLEAQLSRLGGTEESRSGFTAEFADSYRDYLRLLLELHREQDAFHILERYRAGSFLRILAQRDLGAPVEIGKIDKDLADVGAIVHGHPRSSVLCEVAGLPLLYFLRFDFNPINLRSPKVESVSTLFDLMNNPLTSPNTIDVPAMSLMEAGSNTTMSAHMPAFSTPRSARRIFCAGSAVINWVTPGPHVTEATATLLVATL